ncbi:MAG: hypothetical protein ACO3P9_03640 [Phycisphaerales bacterium]
MRSLSTPRDEAVGSSTFERSLLAYALAGGAATTGASGAIVYSGVQNQSMALTVGNTLAIDLDGDTNDDFSLRYVDPNSSDSSAPFQLEIAPVSGSEVVGTGQKVGSAGVAAALSAGSTIDSGSQWGGNASIKVLAQFDKANGTGSNTWAGLSNRYIGGRVETAPSSGQYLYGWIQLSVPGNALAGGTTPTSVTVHDWAYETTVGQSILAGSTTSVPGGGAMALLSLGASGLGRWRSRRKLA